MNAIYPLPLELIFGSTYSGNVIIPDNRSRTYRSAIGLLDERIDLDKNIKPNNPNYYASLSIMAAKLSYENESAIKTTVENNWNVCFIYLSLYSMFQYESSSSSCAAWCINVIVFIVSLLDLFLDVDGVLGLLQLLEW